MSVPHRTTARHILCQAILPLLLAYLTQGVVIRNGDVTVPGTMASFPLAPLGTFSYWDEHGVAKVRFKGRPTVVGDKEGLLLSDEQLQNVSLVVAASEDILGLLNPDFTHHADEEDPKSSSAPLSMEMEASALVCKRAKSLHRLSHHSPIPLQPQRTTMTLTSPGKGVQTLWILNCLWPSQDIGVQVSESSCSRDERALGKREGG